MTGLRPILPGFYPDPSICRVGDSYFIVNSSFEFLPGLPIHTSTDLVTWTPVGNALARASQVEEHEGGANSGIYAPTIRYHADRFWIIGTNILDLGKGLGHFIMTAEDPAGPWSDPVHVQGTIGIDPDITWDERDVCRITWASVDPAHPGIVSAPVDPLTGVLLESPQRLWQGSGLAHPEGPHLYRIDGWWYLLLAEGGTERGHVSTIARARALEGPFESAPNNPILTHRSTADPVQNVGHADLVELADGSWAAVHLGVRPRGQTPGFHVNGRETFVVGIDWVDGWPVADEERFAVSGTDHSFTDRFPGTTLDQRWLGAGSFPESFTSPASTGGRVIDAASGAPGKALLAFRARDDAWTAEARFTTHDGDGRFTVRMNGKHWYGLVRRGDNVDAVLAIGPAVLTVGHVALTAGETPTLRIRSGAPQSGSFFGPEEPDVIELSVLHDDGSQDTFGPYDGRYLSTEVAGGFLGRLIGIEALRGRILVESVTYTSGPRAS